MISSYKLRAKTSLPLHPFHPFSSQPNRPLISTTRAHSPTSFFARAFFLSCLVWSTARQERWITMAARGRLEGGRRREERKERKDRVVSGARMCVGRVKRDAGEVS
jgi:hypothetical protein